MTRKRSKSSGRKTQELVNGSRQCLSDAELRSELIALGVSVGPITSTTRAFYLKQLEKRRQNRDRSPGSLDPPLRENSKFYTPPYLLRTLPSRMSYSTSPSSSHVSESRNLTDSEDDHMESSRIITTHHGGGHNSRTEKSSTLQWILNKLPKFSPNASSRHCNSSSKSWIPYRSFSKGFIHSFTKVIPAGGVIFNSHISHVLLHTLLTLFGFLLIAYFATVNSSVFIPTSRIVYASVKDTAYFLYTYAILPFLALSIGCGTVTGAYMLRRYQIRKKAAERQLTFDLIEEITNIIRNASEQGQLYIAEPHVRDMLLAPCQRMPGSPDLLRWKEAVNFINLNESRVSTETRIIGGVECSVWRWLPAIKIQWQGSGELVQANSSRNKRYGEGLPNASFK